MASQFYGLIQGQAGEATRKGSKRSGYRAWAQNGTGRIAIDLWHSDADDVDYADITIDSSTINYGWTHAIRLAGGIDLSALANHSGDPQIQRHLDRARKAINQASARATKLAEKKRR